MNSLNANLQWWLEAWQFSMIQAIGVGSLSILVFLAIDTFNHPLKPSLRCWMWRVLYLKLALLMIGTCAWWSPPIAWQPPIAASLHTASPASFVSSYEAPVQYTYAPADRISACWSTDTHQDQSSIKTISLSNPTAVSQTDSVNNWLQHLLMLALSLWLVGVLTLVIRSVLAYRRLSSQIQQARVPADPRLLNIYMSVARELGIRGSPELQVVAMECSPCLLWHGKLSVVMPEAFLDRFGVAATRMAIAHELGHYVRRDLIWNMLATMVSMWLFFLPWVWLMNRRYRLALETACDAFTIDRAQIDRKSYAALLIGLGSNPNRWAAATTFVAMADSLSFRALSKRLNAMKYQNVGQSWLRKARLGALTCLAVSVLLPWSLAVDPPENQKQDTPTSPVGNDPNQVIVGDGRVASNDVAMEVKVVTDENGTVVESQAISSSDDEEGQSVKRVQQRNKKENISKTFNVNNGKKSLAIVVDSDERKIAISESDEKGMTVDIRTTKDGNQEANSYKAVNRDEFKKKFPTVYQAIAQYMTDPTPPVPPMPPMPGMPPLPPRANMRAFQPFPTPPVPPVPPVPPLPGPGAFGGQGAGREAIERQIDMLNKHIEDLHKHIQDLQKRLKDQDEPV